MLGLSYAFINLFTYQYLSWSSLRTPVFLELDLCMLSVVIYMYMYMYQQICDFWVVLVWTMLHERMCLKIHLYLQISSFYTYCASMLKRDHQKQSMWVLNMHAQLQFQRWGLCLVNVHTFMDMSTYCGHMDGHNEWVFCVILCLAHSTHVFQAVQASLLFCRLCKCCCFNNMFYKMTLNQALLKLWKLS